LIGITTPISSSQAIFGLSKCEKIQKQINSEISIGDRLFKKSNIDTKSIFELNANSNSTAYRGQVETALRSLIVLLESDQKAIKLADTNGHCYSVADRASLRNAVSGVNRVVKLIKGLIKTESYSNDYYPKLFYNDRYVLKSTLNMKN
jgi:hypothetical protein